MDDDTPAFQDLYPEPWSHCYGCGPLNDHGLRVRSRWDGQGTVAVFRPEPHHIAFRGIVYGGLIAAVIDCHSTGSAAAARHRANGGADDQGPYPRFVTGRLAIDYLRPTPLDDVMTLRSTIDAIEGRKVTVSTNLHSGGNVTATGRAVLIEVPDGWESAAEAPPAR